MAQNYKSMIGQANTGLELSCVWELIRDAFWNRKSISREMYDKRSAECTARRKEIERRFKRE